MRGQSRRRKKKKNTAAIIGAVFCVIGLAAVLFLFRFRIQESVPEAASAEEPAIETEMPLTETEPPVIETEPAESGPEPETEPPGTLYFDKSWDAS